jgi:hypothetical protein
MEPPVFGEDCCGIEPLADLVPLGTLSTQGGDVRPQQETGCPGMFWVADAAADDTAQTRHVQVADKIGERQGSR